MAAKSIREDLWGVENLSGIPGTVGGAVVQNIGAYGAVLSGSLKWVEAFDTQSGDSVRFSNKECAFGYRDSFFKHDDGRYIVLGAAFTLSTSPKPTISYKDLQELFDGVRPSLPAIREGVLSIRKGKFPDLAMEGTAGSFFKNPIFSASLAQALAKRHPGMPLFLMPETVGVKVPLAWLLDHALSLRGTQVGCARLFEKQLLVIAVKNSPAEKRSALDVKKLAGLVQEKVKSELHIDIEPEVRIL